MDAPPSPLVSAAELLRRLHEVVLLDARAGGRAAFDAGHLPGARYVDLERDLAGPAEAPERGGRHPLPSLPGLCARLGRWGIGPDTEVVVYDAEGGGNAAARAWWMLRALGHRNVRVLDGGLPAALEAGIALETEERTPTPMGAYPAASWLAPLADIDRVDQVRRDPSFVVLDVRSAARFAGDAEPIDPIAGHIPGAVNAFWGDALDATGRFKAPEDLRRSLGAVLRGVPPERRIVHCGSGVTACHTLLALEHAGLGGAALYVGSWSEWCRSGRERAP